MNREAGEYASPAEPIFIGKESAARTVDCREESSLFTDIADALETSSELLTEYDNSMRLQGKIFDTRAVVDGSHYPFGESSLSPTGIESEKFTSENNGEVWNHLKKLTSGELYYSSHFHGETFMAGLFQNQRKTTSFLFHYLVEWRNEFRT